LHIDGECVILPIAAGSRAALRVEYFQKDDNQDLGCQEILQAITKVSKLATSLQLRFAIYLIES